MAPAALPPGPFLYTDTNMNQTTHRIALAVAALAALSLVVIGCGPKPVEAGKNDTPQQKELRKEKTGD